MPFCRVDILCFIYSNGLVLFHENDLRRVAQQTDGKGIITADNFDSLKVEMMDRLTRWSGSFFDI